MGRKKVSMEIQKEKTRLRNARHYQKTKKARAFYDMVKNNLNDKGDNKVENNEKADSKSEEAQ